MECATWNKFINVITSIRINKKSEQFGRIVVHIFQLRSIPNIDNKTVILDLHLRVRNQTNCRCKSSYTEEMLSDQVDHFLTFDSESESLSVVHQVTSMPH